MIKRPPLESRLSVPAPGRTILASAKEWGFPLYESKRRLQSELPSDLLSQKNIEYFERLFSFPSTSAKLSASPDLAAELMTSTMVMNWVMGQAIGPLDRQASLIDAESWIAGTGDYASLIAGQLPVDLQQYALEPLLTLDYSPDFIDIFPYASEVFETGSEIISAIGTSRASKRNTGVFYTPSDVADYLIALSVSSTTKGSMRTVTFLDPACGTGAILIAALYRLSNENKVIPGEMTLDLASKMLFGIDISLVALQTAVYAITLTSFGTEARSIVPLLSKMQALGKNFFHRDAIDFLEGRESLSRINKRLKGGATWVVSNPPYVKRRKPSNWPQTSFLGSSSHQNLTQSRSRNIFLDFLRMIPILGKRDHGGGAMILPLSITYNTQKEFRAARIFMAQCRGIWRFASFDRTPDSIFGDDVKIRASVVAYTHSETYPPNLETTSLLRWSSRNRAKLFNEIEFFSIESGIPHISIPKIGSCHGSRIFHSLRAKRHHYLAEDIKAISDPGDFSGYYLRNPKTAYNWLPFECAWDNQNSVGFSDGRSYRYWLIQESDAAYAIFALTQSRLAYWWWRVWSDGFHMTDTFIRSLPLGLSNFDTPTVSELVNAGKQIWQIMKCNPVVSVNAGTETISYRPYDATDTILIVDRLISESLDLPSKTPSFLQDYWFNTVVAGREDEITTNPALEAIRDKIGGPIVESI